MPPRKKPKESADALLEKSKDEALQAVTEKEPEAAVETNEADELPVVELDESFDNLDLDESDTESEPESDEVSDEEPDEEYADEELFIESEEDESDAQNLDDDEEYAENDSEDLDADVDDDNEIADEELFIENEPDSSDNSNDSDAATKPVSKEERFAASVHQNKRHSNFAADRLQRREFEVGRNQKLLELARIRNNKKVLEGTIHLVTKIRSRNREATCELQHLSAL